MISILFDSYILLHIYIYILFQLTTCSAGAYGLVFDSKLENFNFDGCYEHDNPRAYLRRT